MTDMEKIAAAKIVPVVKLNKVEETEGVLGALEKGGIPTAEITFRTACAADAIKYASEHFPEMIVGAGTVINAKQAEQAVYAGAEFIVGPGWSDSVAEFCASASVPRARPRHKRSQVFPCFRVRRTESDQSARRAVRGRQIRADRRRERA